VVALDPTEQVRSRYPLSFIRHFVSRTVGST